MPCLNKCIQLSLSRVPCANGCGDESFNIMHELLKLSATEAVDLLVRREITPVELVEASAGRIETVEPSVNAMPTLCVERAMKQAKRMMDQSPSDMVSVRGWLGGLPVSVKDVTETKDVKTTFGSPIYQNHVPRSSDVMVERIESRGGIVMGKSNTPEFGAGASTFNEVFGTTHNPWNTNKSVAGSSGGACASVATGEVWLATGSDLGGSLRTPASFNSVAGLRPSPGRVPHSSMLPFDTLSVNGPVARNCADIALFLDTMAGFHPAHPLSYPAPDTAYVDAISAPAIPRRIGWSPDLGITTVDAEVRSICENAVRNFANLGATVTDECPSFAGAVEAFGTLRAAGFAYSLASTLEKHRDQLKPEVVWNIEQGLALTADDIGRAETVRGRIYRSLARFFDTHDLLACPCAIVPPFDVGIRYVESVGDVKFDTYFEWIAITFALTLTGCPVLAVPAGFTSDGLPVGLQIAAPPRDESSLLSAGHLLELETEICQLLPIDPVATDAGG